MKITFINVGYGDAILIEQEGKAILLDGGSALPEEFDGFPFRIRTKEYLVRAGINKIDLAIVSHIHDDHVGGIAALQIPIDKIWIPYDKTIFTGRKELWPDEKSPRNVKLFSGALNDFSKMITSYEKKDPNVVETVTAWKSLRIGDATISVLAPLFGVKQSFEERIIKAYLEEEPTESLVWLDSCSNSTSMIVKIEIGKTAILLPGDSVPAGWKGIDFSLLKNVNVLKLPHHGQKDSVSEEMLASMPLEYVITTSSSDRRYESANREVYEKLLKWHPEVQLLFSDERAYEPYFSQRDGFIATKLVIDSEGIHSEFVI